MFSKVLIVALMALTIQAQAAGPLVGKWKFVESRCKSGAPSRLTSGSTSNDPGYLKITISFFEAYATVSETQAVFSSKAKVDFDQQEIAQNIALFRSAPSTPQNDQNLRQLLQFQKGLDCTTKTVSNYHVLGNVIFTNDLSEENSCASFSAPSPEEKKSDSSEFTITGDKLVITGLEAVSTENKACPRGDHVITVMQRAK
jgi:hypothetical protein